MVSKIRPITAFDCIVFGGTGDLAKRKLIPALYQRYRAGYFTDPLRIIGTSRSITTHEGYRSFVKEALETYVPAEEMEEEKINKFLACFYAVKMDVEAGQGWEELRRFLEKSSHKLRAFYLAVNPTLFGGIAFALGSHNLVHENTRIILEKPIGRDLSSAVALNDSVGSVFAENQIFRIDHYLGKETVQNLMALRFANMLYEPLWNSHYIEYIEILVAEQVGLEKRASYYDQAGALRDMVQNHMLQLLCLVAMEPPSSKDADALRDEKLKILNALKPIDVHNSNEKTVRGQYNSGCFQGKRLSSYFQDLGREKSTTETFVALKAEIMNWRWAGTPFYLRTGKRMGARVSEIIVTFKSVPHNIFNIESNEILPNRLVIRLQPGEGVKQWLMIKEPGPGGLRLRSVPLDMSFANNFRDRNPEAYERLLTDALRGDQTLFMRRDEVEAAWRWIDPILKAWQENQQEIYPYPAGSYGPKEAEKFMQKDGFQWWAKF